MAEWWKERGAQYMPGEAFETPWALYKRAARIIIDEKLEVDVALKPEAKAEGGIISSDVADFLGEDDSDTVEIAKKHMAFRMASAAFVWDLVNHTDVGLDALLEEARGEISLQSLRADRESYEGRSVAEEGSE